MVVGGGGQQVRKDIEDTGSRGKSVFDAGRKRLHGIMLNFSLGDVQNPEPFFFI